MKTAFLALACVLGVAAAPASAQSPAHFEDQVVRGVTHLAQLRTKRLGVFEWMKERVEIEAVRHGVTAAAASRHGMVGVVTAHIRVSQSRKVREAEITDDLPLDHVVKRYEVALRFVPDPNYGKWAFESGRYWVLDGEGRRASELAMFPNLLTDAPSDAPHALAWAIMAP